MVKKALAVKVYSELLNEVSSKFPDGTFDQDFLIPLSARMITNGAVIGTSFANEEIDRAIIGFHGSFTNDLSFSAKDFGRFHQLLSHTEGRIIFSSIILARSAGFVQLASNCMKETDLDIDDFTDVMSSVE